MKEITIRGKSGKWNEKIYSGNTIYLNNEEIYLTDEEKKQLLTSKDNNTTEADCYNNIKNIIVALSTREKLRIVKNLAIDILRDNTFHLDDEDYLSDAIQKLQKIC